MLCHDGPMDRDLTLDNQLCFALNAAARAASNAYRSELTDLGLTYPQYLTLLALWENDGLTVSELGGRLRLDSGTLSPLLRRLQDTGYVERRRHSRDERRVSIYLTPAGHELKDRMAEVQRCLAGRITMTAEEIATLHRLAKRFCEALGESERTVLPKD